MKTPQMLYHHESLPLQFIPVNYIHPNGGHFWIFAKTVNPIALADLFPLTIIIYTHINVQHQSITEFTVNILFYLRWRELSRDQQSCQGLGDFQYMFKCFIPYTKVCYI